MLQECLTQLNLRNMWSISMDGPNVNWKFIELIQKEHAEQFGGSQLVMVGSCGLHTLHNAFKCGFTMWEMEKLLRALHYLFHNTPARREDYTKLTESSEFPLAFCGHRWIENLPVVERAIKVWPNIQKYVHAVTTKKLKDPHTSSYDTVSSAQRDPLIMAKFHFFMSLSRTFTPFLTKYQTDLPMMPFLAKDLTDLVKNVMKRFIKTEHQETTAERVSQVDVTNKDIWVNHSQVDPGMGVRSVIKELLKKKTVSQLAVMEFHCDCIKGMAAMCQKILAKSPLKYPIVRQLSCLDPKRMYSDREACTKNMCKLVQKLLQDKQVANVGVGDAIMQQYGDFLDQEAKDVAFQMFNIDDCDTRVDTFLYEKMKGYHHLWDVCKKLLLLSHGQATVERGFSINKEVETCNMQADTIIAHRQVCDYVEMCGGVCKVPITKELLNSVSSARSRYRAHLEEERKKKQKTEQGRKRKRAEDDIETVKKKRKTLTDICQSLSDEADKLSEQAEKKSGVRMAELVTKSNAMRKRMREKRIELHDIDSQLKGKVDELKLLPYY